MNAPILDAWRFLVACLLGLPLGACYSFLRPLHRRHPVASDLLFLPVLFYGWLYLGFAVCHGDIRIGYCAGLALGIFLWELTLGRWLRPVFLGVWHLISRIYHGILRIFQKIFKKIRKILKNVFAIWKKWVTIIWTNCQKRGGVPDGEKE